MNISSNGGIVLGMRRIFISGLVLVVLLFSPIFSLWSENLPLPACLPKNAAVLGAGGGFTALEGGYPALLGNPGAFASSKASFTALSVNPWVYGSPPSSLSSLFNSQDYSEYLRWASPEGAGFGGSLGIGYVGKGLALGFINSTDFIQKGKSFPSGTSGYLVSDFSLVGGLAFTPLTYGGLSLSLGADLRPTIRFFTRLSAATVVDYLSQQNSSVLNQTDMYQGAALALDGGLLARIGSTVTLGFSVRDILDTKYNMSYYPLGTWLDTLQRSGLPNNGSHSADAFYVPMSFNTGFAYQPIQGKLASTVDPRFSLDLVNIETLFDGSSSVLENLKGGLDVRFFSWLSLRGGYDQGSLTGGLGFKIFALDLNLAVFTPLPGVSFENAPTSGISMETAFRF